LSESKIWKQAIAGCVRLWARSLPLILVWLISAGCTTPSPTPFQPDNAICRAPNNEQLESWDRMVELAAIDLDPYQIRLGVLWSGGHLWRCRALTPQ
jgi:hypothetical protein